MMRWEGYTADGGAAVRWHEMNRDAAKADSFGVAERGNAVLRPQMTALRPTRPTNGDLLAGFKGAGGCAIVTGATKPLPAHLCTVIYTHSLTVLCRARERLVFVMGVVQFERMLRQREVCKSPR